MENGYLLFKQASAIFQDQQDDFVKIAGIVRRIQNWWKGLFDAEFREQREKISHQYGNLREPISVLVQAMRQLDSAFRDQDPEESSRLISEIHPLIVDVTNQLKGLDYKMIEAKQSISDKILSRVQHGYTKDPETLKNIINTLPEDFKADFGTYLNEKNEARGIGKPISSFIYFSKFVPTDVSVSKNVAENIKQVLSKASGKEVSETDLHVFINELRKAIFRDSTVVQSVYFPEVSKETSSRIAGETIFLLTLGEPVSSVIDGKPISISVPELKINNLSTRFGTKETQEKKLSIVSFPNPKNIQSQILTNLVKQGIWKQKLPLCVVLVRISSNNPYQNLHFAKVCTTALRSNLQPQISCIHFDGTNTEIQTEINGSNENVKNTVQNLLESIANVYNEYHKSNICIQTSLNKSNIKLARSEDFDSSYRKLYLKSLGENGHY
jgi:hypothetical protein